MSTKSRQLDLRTCSNCGRDRRTEWRTYACNCEYGEEMVKDSRAEYRARPESYPQAVMLPPGNHYHGVWVCVVCRQRSLDWSAVPSAITADARVTRGEKS
jgi:hypothetical protein